jgi:hypothetical protein
MTGPWQILGPGRASLETMGPIDYLYIANWSLWADVKILLRTVPHVLERHRLQELAGDDGPARAGAVRVHAPRPGARTSLSPWR